MGGSPAKSSRACRRCGRPVDDPWRMYPADEAIYHGGCLLAEVCGGKPAGEAGR